MHAVFCFALLASVAVIGVRGDTCLGTDTSTCTHERCVGTVNDLSYNVVCHDDQCTCEVTSTPGGSTAATPTCYSHSDCNIHCSGDHMGGHMGGHMGHHGGHHYSNVQCVNGNCHCVY